MAHLETGDLIRRTPSSFRAFPGTLLLLTVPILLMILHAAWTGRPSIETFSGATGFGRRMLFCRQLGSNEFQFEALCR